MSLRLKFALHKIPFFCESYCKLVDRFAKPIAKTREPPCTRLVKEQIPVMPYGKSDFQHKGWKSQEVLRAAETANTSFMKGYKTTQNFLIRRAQYQRFQLSLLDTTSQPKTREFKLTLYSEITPKVQEELLRIPP